MSSTAHISRTVHKINTKKVTEASLQLFFYVAILFILLLTGINIQNFVSPVKVLGIQTKMTEQGNSDEAFWNDFLAKNPNYIPGWIDMGRQDKANAIDPNFK